MLVLAGVGIYSTLTSLKDSHPQVGYKEQSCTNIGGFSSHFRSVSVLPFLYFGFCTSAFSTSSSPQHYSSTNCQSCYTSCYKAFPLSSLIVYSMQNLEGGMTRNEVISVLYHSTLIHQYLPILKGPGFNSTSPAMISRMGSIGITQYCEGVLRRLSIDLHLSGPATRRSVIVKQIGSKKALVNRHRRLLRFSLLLPTATSRVDSVTKGRKRWCAGVCCKAFLFPDGPVLDARL